ncbi:MAG: flagellar basal body rod protein FlgB [Lachnospiraceae bacterium]|nr:flagellar basal body rod protein FlgB [Lachnospiraceae bacterium]
MIGSDAYNYINVLGKAANASQVRNEVLTNNLANVDTPNYKRQDVSFENYLQTAIAGNSSLDKAMRNLRLDSLNSSIYTDTASLSYRLDGNNVDVDTENAYLAQNQIRYYTLVDSISQEFSRIKSVLK